MFVRLGMINLYGMVNGIVESYKIDITDNKEINQILF